MILVSEIIPFQKRGEPPNFGCSLTGLSCPRYRFGSSRVSGPVTWAPTHGRRRYSCKHKLRFIFMKLAVEDPKLAKGDPAFGAKLITGLHLIYCFRLRLARICRALIATHCGDLSNDRRGCFNQWIVSNQAHRSLKAPALLV